MYLHDTAQRRARGQRRPAVQAACAGGSTTSVDGASPSPCPVPWADRPAPDSRQERAFVVHPHDDGPFSVNNTFRYFGWATPPLPSGGCTGIQLTFSPRGPGPGKTSGFPARGR